MKVFVDGENFRHQIAQILADEGLIAYESRNDYFKFDVAGFLASVLDASDQLQINYYTTHIKQPEFAIPAELADRLTRIHEANRRWVASLVNQGVQVIKAGYLKVRESSACVHCGKRTQVLQEKGVDVRVATDMLLAASAGEHVALVSSDSDIGPAVEAAIRSGGTVSYVCPANRVNRALVAQASQVITFDTKKVITYYKDQP